MLVRGRKGWHVSRSFFFKRLSTSQQMQWEAEASSSLRAIIEPITNNRLYSLGCIESIKINNSGHVQLKLNLIVPGYPFVSKIEKSVADALSTFPWYTGHCLEVSHVRGAVRATTASESGLQQVCHVVGVSSCKGGVGKSTVAVNLACRLAQRGLKVGLLDADIYGPSLPSMLTPVDDAVRRSPRNPKFVLPLEAAALPNLQMLSFGHVNPKAGAPGAGGKEAAVMRGPLVSKVLNQLLLATDWGSLDYLVVDMPPGTGDVQITLTQSVQLSGAVVVTTPHRLAVVDAAKGVSMFDEVDVPVLAVVENMAYFRCRHGEIYHPFGRGGQQQLLRTLISSSSSDESKMNDFETAYQHDIWRKTPYVQLPITAEGAAILKEDETVAKDPSSSHASSDKLMEGGFEERGYLPPPAVIAEPQGDTAQRFDELANAVIAQIFAEQTSVQLVPTVDVRDEGRTLRLCYFSTAGNQEVLLPAKALRAVDPSNGVKLSDHKQETSHSNRLSNVTITRSELKGMYGVSITWSDQRVDIYRYDVLRDLGVSLSTM